jgi:hypothetical protein
MQTNKSQNKKSDHATFHSLTYFILFLTQIFFLKSFSLKCRSIWLPGRVRWTGART